MWLLLFLSWLAFNARVSLDVMLSGVLVTFLVLLFLKKIGRYDPKKDLLLFKMVLPALLFVLELIWNIVLSNIHMTYLVLFSKSAEIKPRLVYFKTPVQTEAGRVAVANSITLTPGTVTVDLSGDKMCVHAIDKVSASGLRDLWAVERVKKMEEKA